MKSKRKLNIIDYLIIILIVCIGIFSVNKLRSKDIASGSGDKSKEIEIVYYIEEVPEYVAKTVEKDDPVKEKIQGSNLGNVTDVKVEDSVSWARDRDGNLVQSSKEGYNSMTIKIKGNGLVDKNGAMIDKSNYYVGQTVAVFVGNAYLETGRIAEIKTLD